MRQGAIIPTENPIMPGVVIPTENPISAPKGPGATIPTESPISAPKGSGATVPTENQTTVPKFQMVMSGQVVEPFSAPTAQTAAPLPAWVWGAGALILLYLLSD